MVGLGVTTGPAPTPGARPADRAAPSPGPASTSAASDTDQVEQLRGELPPPVQRRSGQKMHGRWVGPDGTAHAIVSGHDDVLTPRVNNVLREAGCPMLPASTAADVELKLAVLMRDSGIRHAIVVTNNTPCQGPLGCDTLLPVVLPEGYALTVYGPNNYRRTFRGGAEPWWR
ncbi:DddA-like double-stranded DNA deaminase toxin [Streptoalloteichus hindustanus]|nr:DddA-like double-stranded DNA deaminase toxin [Streptoalloteichus hindustanus]